MVSPEETGRELERYVPKGELDQQQVEQLALVGLSSAFPDRVLELNEGLLWLGKRGSFRGFRFSLNPDETHPKVDVEARYTSPYDITIDADVEGHASLRIWPKLGNKTRGSGSLSYLRLDQLREFTDEYPTDETILLRATHKPDSYARSSDPAKDEVPPAGIIEDIAVPLTEVNTKSDLETLGITPIHFDLEIGFMGRTALLGIELGYADEDRVEEPVFSMREFHAEDTPQNIETVVGSFGRLLKKHFMHRGNID